jgi:hypothetical protein
MMMFKHALWAVVPAAIASLLAVGGDAVAAGIGATGNAQAVVSGAAVPTGYQQLTNVSVATGFTPPTGTQWCNVVASAAIRFRADGTLPTATVGYPVAANTGWKFRMTNAGLLALKFIPQSGTTTLDIDCYKDY